MSFITGFATLIAVLLLPVGLIALMVYVLVRITNAENSRRNRKMLEQAQLPDLSESNVRLRVFTSKGMTIYGMVLASIVLAFGIFTLLLHPVTALVIGWWVALVSALLLIKLTKQVLNSEPLLVLTDSYIENASWPYRRVNWKNVKRAHISRLLTAGVVAIYINLEVDNEKELLNGLGLFTKTFYRLSRLFGGSPIQINATALRIKPDELMSHIKQFIPENAVTAA